MKYFNVGLNVGIFMDFLLVSSFLQALNTTINKHRRSSGPTCRWMISHVGGSLVGELQGWVGVSTLTVLVGLNLELFALHHSLWVTQDQLDTQVGKRRQVVDGVLGVAALGVVAHLLPGLLLATHFGAVLHRQVVAVAAGHVVAQRLPAYGHLCGLDVHHFQASWAVHGLWGGGGERQEGV